MAHERYEDKSERNMLLATGYIEVCKKIDSLDKEIAENKVLGNLKQRIKGLKDQIEEEMADYQVRMLRLEDHRDEIVERLKETYDGEHKTVRVMKVKLSFRDTRFLEVRDPYQIVRWLIDNGKVANGIKSFDVKWLMGCANADVLPKGSYEVLHKLYLSLKILEE